MKNFYLQTLARDDQNIYTQEGKFKILSIEYYNRIEKINSQKYNHVRIRCITTHLWKYEINVENNNIKIENSKLFL